MSVQYNSKKLIPAPFATIQNEKEITEDGTVIGATFQIQLKGTIVAYKGSPDSTGALWTLSGEPADEVISDSTRLKSILKKQEAIRGLFATDGYALEIQPLDGSSPLKCYPRVKQVVFDEGLWYDKCEYTVTMEADDLFIGDTVLTDNAADYKISRASNEWNLEIFDETQNLYRLTHSVSAVGKRYFTSDGLSQEAWQNARDYVLNGLGLGIVPERMVAADVVGQPDVAAFNYVRSQSVGEKSGTFSVTETWLCYTLPEGGIAAYEEYSVNARTSAEGRTSVSVEGTINGLQVSNNTTYEVISTRYANAELKWAEAEDLILTRAEEISGFTLHPSPLTKVVGKNEITGVTTYTYEYDDRPSANISGALQETITVSYQNPTDFFATIQILGRAIGPILQDIGTATPRKKTVSIEAQLPAANRSSTPSMPATDALMLTFKPSSSYGVFLDGDVETWTPSTGKYSRNTSWTWE